MDLDLVFNGGRRSSQAVSHPSTDRALRRLTSEVRRDPVHSTRYGRQRTSVIANCVLMCDRLPEPALLHCTVMGDCPARAAMRDRLPGPAFLQDVICNG